MPFNTDHPAVVFSAGPSIVGGSCKVLVEGTHHAADAGGGGGLSLGAIIGVSIVISALVAAFLTMLLNYVALRYARYAVSFAQKAVHVRL